MKQVSQLDIGNLGAFYKTPNSIKCKYPVPNYGEV